MKFLEAKEEANSPRLTGMVSMQASDRAENSAMVRSLVQWKVGNDFMGTPSLSLFRVIRKG